MLTAHGKKRPVAHETSSGAGGARRQHTGWSLMNNQPGRPFHCQFTNHASAYTACIHGVLSPLMNGPVDNSIQHWKPAISIEIPVAHHVVVRARSSHAFGWPRNALSISMQPRHSDAPLSIKAPHDGQLRRMETPHPAQDKPAD